VHKKKRDKLLEELHEKEVEFALLEIENRKQREEGH
jgi:hypothetical protein